MCLGLVGYGTARCVTAGKVGLGTFSLVMVRHGQEKERSIEMVFKPERKYTWKEGWNPKISAETVGNVITEIEEKNGVVTKELFLEASRPEDSPTHDIFEWDDKVAGELYRLSISNKVIIQLKVEIETGEDQKEKAYVPAFINIKSANEGAEYKNIVDALSEQETRELILKRLRREVEALIERNKHIDELADILQDAVNQLKTA